MLRVLLLVTIATRAVTWSPGVTRPLSVGERTTLPPATSSERVFSETTAATSDPACGPLILPKTISAQPVLERYPIDANVTLSCLNITWTLVGQSWITCPRSASWDSLQLPICEYLECPSPLDLDHGTVIIAHPASPGTWAQYSCSSGYTLVGAHQRACSYNTTWRPQEEPLCKVDCGTIQIPSNAKIQQDCTHEGCVATATCDHGYHIKGTDKITCTPDGTWTHEYNATPSCESVFCPAPVETFANGDLSFTTNATNGNYIYDTVMTVVCHEGYSNHGNVDIRCTHVGTWSETIPVCLASVSPIPTTPGATQADTTIGGGSPAPSQKPCPSPGPLAGGFYNIYGKTVVYKCHHGYRLTGQGERMCLRNATWTGILPRCLPVRPVEAPSGAEWRQVYVEHKQWTGSYLFKGEPVPFKFYVMAVHRNKGIVEALLYDEHHAKLDLKGFHSTDAIVFQVARLLNPTPQFPNTQWQVSGQLHHDDHGWQYVGKVWSQQVIGFTTFAMRPSAGGGSELPVPPGGLGEGASVTALSLGVIIAVLSILAAAALAAYCVKRKGGLKGGTHRTLTSFENPVYEYENSLKENI